MSECIHCEAVEEPEHGIIVGLTDRKETVCNVCRADELAQETALSDREADVVALKQLGGYSHERIAELLDLQKSTVDEYSRRANEKLERAQQTVAELDPIMSDSQNADDEPLPEIDAERQAIREALEGTDIHVLTYHGGEPSVALVQRERPPSTEHTTAGEQVVLVEWHGGEDYALSVAEGESTGWELTDELVQTAETREAALEAAEELFAEE